MRAAAGSKRVLITVPHDVREFLEERARYHGGTISAEAVISIRERMERERKHRFASKADAAAAE